jgi:MFS family permease
MILWFRSIWEWLLCGFVLLSLGLFLLGHDLLGLNGYWATLLALLASVLATLVGFVMATLVLPLVGLITAIIGAFIGLVTVILAFLVGGIFTPLAAAVVGAIYSLLGWLATTWLGSLLMPLYSTLGPLVLKVAPWLTTSKYAVKIYDWADDQPWWPKALVLTPKKKSKAKSPTINAKRRGAVRPPRR